MTQSILKYELVIVYYLQSTFNSHLASKNIIRSLHEQVVDRQQAIEIEMELLTATYIFYINQYEYEYSRHKTMTNWHLFSINL